MSLSGDVHTFSLNLIFQMIYHAKKSGALAIKKKPDICTIHFKKGMIISSQGNKDKFFRLGALLRANQLVNESEYQHKLNEAKNTNKKLGQILREKDLISQNDLEHSLMRQFKEVALKALSWKNASYAYEDKRVPDEPDIQLELNPMKLIAEAKRFLGFEKLIPNDKVVFQQNLHLNKTRTIFTANERRLILLVNGKRTVLEIIRETNFSKLATYQILAKLYSQKIITRSSNSRSDQILLDTNKFPLISYYYDILKIMIVDMVNEIGGSKTNTIICHGLKAFNVNQTNLPFVENAPNFAQFDTAQFKNLFQVIQANLDITSYQNFFYEFLTHIFNAQYEIVGEKSVRRTIGEMIQHLRETTKTNDLSISPFITFLNTFKDKKKLS